MRNDSIESNTDIGSPLRYQDILRSPTELCKLYVGDDHQPASRNYRADEGHDLMAPCAWENSEEIRGDSAEGRREIWRAAWLEDWAQHAIFQWVELLSFRYSSDCPSLSLSLPHPRSVIMPPHAHTSTKCKHRSSDDDSVEEPSSSNADSTEPERPAKHHSTWEKEAFLERYDVEVYSAEEIRDQQVKRWKAKVYEHFVMPPGIKMTVDGEVLYKFVCKQ
ncbi:hypothetical protein M422DRAFT_44110 [Sphaerobolus stellatus SS14]|nr:hypothetical protein M422DRAFT_44110 [Sphaerobolus stellatus SS14]